MPCAPVWTSPDGALAAGYREVVQRRPHEFKIAALSALAELFSESGRNAAEVPVFAAGFGNRKTDVLAYRAVRVAAQRIFVVEPSSSLTVVGTGEVLGPKGYLQMASQLGRLIGASPPSPTESTDAMAAHFQHGASLQPRVQRLCNIRLNARPEATDGLAVRSGDGVLTCTPFALRFFVRGESPFPSPNESAVLFVNGERVSSVVAAVGDDGLVRFGAAATLSGALPSHVTSAELGAMRLSRGHNELVVRWAALETSARVFVAESDSSFVSISLGASVDAGLRDGRDSDGDSLLEMVQRSGLEWICLSGGSASALRWMQQQQPHVAAHGIVVHLPRDHTAAQHDADVRRFCEQVESLFAAAGRDVMSDRPFYAGISAGTSDTLLLRAMRIRPMCLFSIDGPSKISVVGTGDTFLTFASLLPALKRPESMSVPVAKHGSTRRSD